MLDHGFNIRRDNRERRQRRRTDGKPLADRATIVNLIGSTKTEEGLKIRCELDTKTYPKGIKVPDVQLGKVKLKKHKFHGDWNYTIHPNKTKKPAKR